LIRLKAVWHLAVLVLKLFKLNHLSLTVFAKKKLNLQLTNKLNFP